MSKTSKKSAKPAPVTVDPKVSKRQSQAAFKAWETIRANKRAAERDAKAKARTSKPAAKPAKSNGVKIAPNGARVIA